MRRLIHKKNYAVRHYICTRHQYLHYIIVPMHVQCMVCVYVMISKRKIVNNYDNEILRILIKNV